MEKVNISSQSSTADYKPGNLAAILYPDLYKKAVSNEPFVTNYEIDLYGSNAIGALNNRYLHRHFFAGMISNLDTLLLSFNSKTSIDVLPNPPLKTTHIVNLMDKETVDMCSRKDLFRYISIIHNIILSTYHGVDDIIFKRLEDYETPEYEKLHCKIYLRSKPDQILKDEVVFYDKFFNNIPEDKQDLFVITYKVFKYESS